MRATRVLLGALPPLVAACASVREPRPLVPLDATAVGAVETYGQGLLATDDSGETLTFALDASASVVAVRVWPGSRLEALYPLRPKDTTYFQTGTHTVRIPPPVSLATLVAAAQSVPHTEAQAVMEADAQRCMWNELRRLRPAPAPRSGADASGRRPPDEPIDLRAIEDRCRRSVGLDRAPPATQRVRVPGGEYFILLVATDQVVDARHLLLKIAAVDITTSSIISVLQALPGFLAGPHARTFAGYAARVGGP